MRTTHCQGIPLRASTEAQILVESRKSPRLDDANAELPAKFSGGTCAGPHERRGRCDRSNPDAFPGGWSGSLELNVTGGACSPASLPSSRCSSHRTPSANYSGWKKRSGALGGGMGNRRNARLHPLSPDRLTQELDFAVRGGPLFARVDGDRLARPGRRCRAISPMESSPCRSSRSPPRSSSSRDPYRRRPHPRPQR